MNETPQLWWGVVVKNPTERLASMMLCNSVDRLTDSVISGRSDSGRESAVFFPTRDKAEEFLSVMRKSDSTKARKYALICAMVQP